MKITSKLIEQFIIEETTYSLNEAMARSGDALNYNAEYMTAKFMANFDVFVTGDRYDSYDARTNLKSELSIFGRNVFESVVSADFGSGPGKYKEFYNDPLAGGHETIARFVLSSFKNTLSTVKPFIESKIIKIIGAPGMFGWLVEMDTDHIIKFFKGGTGDWNSGAHGSGEMQWYTNMKDRAFTGKGSRSEMMIYDIDTIKVGDEKINYVEMSKILPWKDYMVYLRKIAPNDKAIQNLVRDFHYESFIDINHALAKIYQDFVKSDELENNKNEFLKAINIISRSTKPDAEDLPDAYKALIKAYNGRIQHSYINSLQKLRVTFVQLHYKLFFRYVRGIYELYESGAVGTDLHKGNFGVTFENPMDPHFVFFDP